MTAWFIYTDGVGGTCAFPTRDDAEFVARHFCRPGAQVEVRGGMGQRVPVEIPYWEHQWEGDA